MGSKGDGANTSGDDVTFCVAGVGCKGRASNSFDGGAVNAWAGVWVVTAASVAVRAAGCGAVSVDDCAKALVVKERMAMEMREFFIRTTFTELLLSRRLT